VTLQHIRDQRGIGMVFELVLVALVLGMVGLAIYQASQNSQRASQNQTAPAASNSAAGLAESAATIVEADSSTDATTSASADNLTAEVIAADNDISSLEGSSDANSF
jgi:Tfp pilus assembly protein PilX